MTVNCAVPLVEPTEAVMVAAALAASTPVVKPCVPATLLMVAMAVLDDDQVTKVVRSALEPSEYCPVAVNCSVWPIPTDAGFGETVMDCGADTTWLSGVLVLDEKVPSPP